MQAAARAIYRIPVFGWFLKDAVHGLPDAKYYFVFNLLVAFACLVYIFGYPLLIVSALAATATMLVTLIYLTAADMFGRLGARVSGGAGAAERGH